jgi:hypothetical protein
MNGGVDAEEFFESLPEAPGILFNLGAKCQSPKLGIGKPDYANVDDVSEVGQRLFMIRSAMEFAR